MKTPVDQQQSGFTIIELMIATSVLATMLIMVTVMMIGIGNLYYKGVNQARVQDAVRTITEDVGRDAQLTNKSPVPLGAPVTFGTVSVSAYCIGNIGYSYVIGSKLDPASPVKHVLWRNTQAVPGTCVAADLNNANPDHVGGGTDGAELVPPNSRLRIFSISAVSPYTITVSIAYGDDDLLDSSLRCKGQTGDNFCAVSTLTTTVVQRIK